MESDKPQHVKMHDLIQDIVIAALCQGDYSLPVMMGAGTGWHTWESYENSIALSMMPHSNFKCLNGLELPKLEAFLLEGDGPSLSLPDNFFQGMQNLKILDISGRPCSFPSSIGDLKNLVTLHLENCELRGGDTSKICNLARLEVLSLRGSTFRTNLPDEIGDLTNLRVLDLTGCLLLSTFPVDSVLKLDQLRELYLCNSFQKWRADDLRKMSALRLVVFTIVIWATSQQLSPGALNFPNLQRFTILYTDCIPLDYFDVQLENQDHYSRCLLIEKCGGVQFEQSGLQDLLQRTEFLQIKSVSGLVKGIGELNAIHGGDQFSQLKKLYVYDCEGMECMLDASNLSPINGQQAVEIFPELQVLTLDRLPNITSLLCCPEPCYYSFFPKLRELKLWGLSQLSQYVLPVQLAAKLKVMRLTYCVSLLYVFSGASEIINESGHGADTSIVELQYMEILELNDLASLVALEDSSNASIIGDEHQILFDDKIKFPSLKRMQLTRLNQIRNLWDFLGSKEPYGRSPCFGNLKHLTIINYKIVLKINECHHLQSLSKGMTRTPRLKHVKLGREFTKADTFDRINAIMAEATAEIMKAKEAEMRSMTKEREAEEAKTRAKAKRREAEEAKKIAKIKIIEAQEAQKIAEEKTREAKEAEMRADAKRREAKEAEMRSELPKRWEVDLAELRVENKRMEADEAQMRTDTYK